MGSVLGVEFFSVTVLADDPEVVGDCDPDDGGARDEGACGASDDASGALSAVEMPSSVARMHCSMTPFEAACE